MPKRCVAAGCSNTNKDGVSLFLFPRDQVLLGQWTKQVCRTRAKWNPTKYSVLCSKHFTADCFEEDSSIAASFGMEKRKRLKVDAVPTLFERPSTGEECGSSVSATRKRKAPVAAVTESVWVGSSQHAKVKRSRSAYEKRERSRLVQELLSPSTSCAPEGSQTEDETEREANSPMPVETTACEVEPQVTPCKKNARIQVTPRSMSVEVQVELKPESKDVGIQCSLDSNPSVLPPSGSSQSESDVSDQEVDYSPSQEASSSLSADSQPQTTSSTPYLQSTTYLVYRSALLLLFTICRFCCTTTTEVRSTVVGSLIRIIQSCGKCGRKWTWESQPHVGNVAAGNIAISAAILYAGALPSKALRIFHNLNCATITRKTYFRHQAQFLFPAVDSLWRRNQTLILSEIRSSSRELALAGDGRADSPGHSAKYGSYSVIDLSSSKVVDFRLVQSNEVGGSYHMEKEGLLRVLEFLQQEAMRVHVIVTDRHRQINKWLRETHPEITHYYDVWHVAKGFRKKLEAAAKVHDCEDIGLWQRSIINHLYWCVGSSASGDSELIQAKWLSLDNHVHDVHSGHSSQFTHCCHGQLQGRKKKWFKRHTKASEKFTALLTNTLLCKDILRLSPLYQTSSLESFHSVIIHFAPKHTALSYQGMHCRLQLAALHFNENCSREQAVTEYGQDRYDILFPKYKKGGYIVRKVTVDPTYDYIDDLFQETFLQCQQGGNPLPLDPPSPLSSSFEKPDKLTAIVQHRSRFSH